MGGSGNTQTSTQTPQLPQWLTQDSHLNVNQLMSTLFPGGNFQQYNPNMNQQVAGFSGQQTQAQNAAGGAFNQAQQTAQAGASANQALTNPNLLYASSNPYLQANVAQMNQGITDSYQFGVAPSEMSSAELAGAFGGSGDAVSRLQNQFDLGQNLGSTDLQAYNENYTNQLGIMNNASQAAGGVASGLFDPATNLNTFGQQEQQQQQNVLNANTTNAFQQQQFPLNLLQQATGILTPYLNAFSGSKTISPNMAAK